MAKPMQQEVVTAITAVKAAIAGQTDLANSLFSSLGTTLREIVSTRAKNALELESRNQGQVAVAKAGNNVDPESNESSTPRLS